MKKSVSKSTHLKKKTASKRASSNSTNENGTRLALIKAAKVLFAKQGLRGTSIRDIAQYAGINSSMISYYFGGKEGLYKECLQEINETRFSMASDILSPPKDEAEYRVRLKMFIENMFSLFLEDRYTGPIIMREFDRAKSPAGPIFKSGFLKVFELLGNFFASAQKKKFIGAHHDPLLLASVFFGTITMQMRMDHIIQKNHGRSLKDVKTREKAEEQLIEFFTKL